MYIMIQFLKLEIRNNNEYLNVYYEVLFTVFEIDLKATQ